MKKQFLFLLLDSILGMSVAQNTYKDSLAAYIHELEIRPASITRDTSLNKTINLYAREYAYFSPDSAIYFSAKALEYAKNAKWDTGMGISYHQMGVFASNKGDNTAALKYLEKALSIWTVNEKSTNTQLKENAYKRKPKTLSSIGIAYDNIGIYTKSLEYYLRALKYYETYNDEKGQATTLGNIGLVYYNLKEYKTALEFYNKALRLDTEIKNYDGIARHLGNMAIVFEEQNMQQKALDYYFKALELKEKYGNPYDAAYTIGNIGNAYASLAESKNNTTSERKSFFNKALEYDTKALQTLQKIGDKNGIARNLGNIGIIYHKQKTDAKAEKNLLKAIAICDEIGMLNEKMDFEIILSEVYLNLGKHKKALEHYKEYSISRDSIFNLEKDKELTSKQLNFDFEKKQAELGIKTEAEKEKAKAVSNEVHKKQQVTIFSVASLLLIVFVFSIFLYSRFRITKKQKIIIEQQKHAVELQKEIVEEKQKEIIDSINYAKRLQLAILATPENITQQVPNNFLLYKPKDIVAGDFYFFETSEKHIFLAAADCTGHGVPGALVSVVCANALTRCVKEFHLTDPGKILDKTRELVLETFKKSGEDVKDGMDISLCSFVNEPNNLTIKWAGAYNPLWYTNNNIMIEIKADKQPIGLTEYAQPFTTHTIQLNSNDMFFLFTDGFADQFGGEKGKKFKYNNLEKLLLANKNLPMKEQNLGLDQAFEQWRGNLEQIDDVCVLGVRL